MIVGVMTEMVSESELERADALSRTWLVVAQ